MQALARSGREIVAARKLLKLVRAAEAPPEPKPPIQIEIVNAADFQKDKVLTVKRDDTGKMTGAAVESVT